EEIIRHHLGHLESVPETMIVYTTIFAYVLSTMLTSIGLLLLVRFKLNSFLEFFPRHIYIGTFGGIGCYLLKTAIKFSVHRSRNYGFDDKTRRAKTKSNHVPIITTLSFLTIFLSFYLVIYSLSIPLEFLIEDGWIFALDDQITMSEFYSNFDFGLINWEAIIKTIPTILTLAYFTILNVNINIGKLKVSLDDNHQLNTDCELIVQGVSNLIAGISGTFQVSFGYEESSLLIKSGINNRVLGLILAFCIGITTYFGQLFIKYIPTIAVGTMIFYLGLEVIKEALIDSWMIFNKLEYLNIIITMFAMITIGLLEGIFIGIVFSYIFFMILNYQKGVIRATFSSNSARSSVRRHYRDQKFLKQLDSQIYVMALQGYMFYRTMKGVEDFIKKILIDCEQNKRPIKFLILNMYGVTGFAIDAVQVLESIQKHLQHQKIYLVICEISHESQQVYTPLKKLLFWNDVTNDHVKFCDEAKEALEWCENLLLGTYYANHRLLYSDNQLVGVQHQTMSSLLNDEYFCSNQVEDAGKIVFENEICLKSKNKLVNILMKAFKEITNEKEEFFNLLVPYFTKEEIQKDSQLWSKGDDPNCIYVVEQGQLSTWIPAENNKPNVIERILPLTMVGELGFFTDKQRPINLVTNTLCVLWKMDQVAYLRMMGYNPVLGAMFMKLAMKSSVERLGCIIIAKSSATAAY
ncbi:10488_t:CDS:2, partial [Entrophospora sp. SA101]